MEVLEKSTSNRLYKVILNPETTEDQFNDLQTQVDKRAVCVNFPGDVTTYNDYDAWNQKAYFIETDTEELTINKLGTHDTIVPINTFVVEGLNSGPDIPLEYGQPVLLSSASRKIKAGHRGIILHVWK